MCLPDEEGRACEEGLIQRARWALAKCRGDAAQYERLEATFKSSARMDSWAGEERAEDLDMSGRSDIRVDKETLLATISRLGAGSATDEEGRWRRKTAKQIADVKADIMANIADVEAKIMANNADVEAKIMANIADVMAKLDAVLPPAKQLPPATA